MMDFLYSLFGFLVAISILVAVHEFGHFWVAKLLGVKVLRYSIGFGHPIWKKTWGRDKTEYMIGSLPLGGYVKMLDEREAEVPAGEQHRAFNRQSVYTRFAIVFAGPLFNFIFAFFAYWMMLVVGVNGLKPVIGEINPDSIIAKAGISKNDEIISINRQTTPIWDVALKELIASAIDKEQVEIVVRQQDGPLKTATIDFNEMKGTSEPDELIAMLGLKPWRQIVKAVVIDVNKSSPASAAGIQKGDVIVQVDDLEINDSLDLIKYVNKRPEQKLQVKVLRKGVTETFMVTPATITKNKKKIGQIGVVLKGGKIPPEMRADYQYSASAGLPESLGMVWKNSILTLKMLGKLLTAELSLRNLSGPINIARYAGYSAQDGISRFLDFLAIVSIGLGIINLLPIPVLDGGHLMFYLVEFVQGRPVSEQVEALGQRVGIVIVIMMMSVAIVSDILRLVGS